MKNEDVAFIIKFHDGREIRIYSNGDVKGIDDNQFTRRGRIFIINRIPEIMENEYRRGFENGLEQGWLSSE